MGLSVAHFPLRFIITNNNGNILDSLILKNEQIYCTYLKTTQNQLLSICKAMLSNNQFLNMDESFQTRLMDLEQTSYRNAAFRQIIKRFEDKQDMILSFLDGSYLKKIFQEAIVPQLKEIKQSVEFICEKIMRIKGYDRIERQVLAPEEKSSFNIDKQSNNQQLLKEQIECDQNQQIQFNCAIPIEQQPNYQSKIDIEKCHNQIEINNSPLKFQYSQFEAEDQQIYNLYNSFEQEERSMINFIQCQCQSTNIFQNPNLILQTFNQKFLQMELKFKECKLLYNFHKMKDINFHQKIDKINNVFFMAELQNNEIIGAFTHLPFDSKPNYIPKQNPKSFICNLTKNVFVYAYKINRTLTYDKNCLIFGNWQIKVKAGSDILQTNWGTNGDCFIRKHYNKEEKSPIKLQWLFGNGASKKELRMKQYQIYCFS